MNDMISWILNEPVIVPQPTPSPEYYSSDPIEVYVHPVTEETNNG